MLLSGVKRALSFGPSSRGSVSCTGDNGSQDSLLSSTFVPLPHDTMGSSHYLAHDDILAATDGDHISICTTEEMEKYESLHRREFAHTRIYDMSLLERVGLDEKLPTILWTISWGKLYDEPRLDSCLLTLEFLMTFETVDKNMKSLVNFCLFGKSFGCDFSHFSKLLDFPKSCCDTSGVTVATTVLYNVSLCSIEAGMKSWTCLVCIVSAVWFEFQIQTQFLFLNQFILTLVLELQFMHTSVPN
jgi:hypothetical protein